MKKIIFVRHAKSSWEHDVPDIERPLKSRSRTDVINVSNEFIQNQISIDAVYSSPAKRALDTCSIFLENIGKSQDLIQICDELYDFGGRQVINFIQFLDANLNTIMIFGHNHALTSIANNYGNTFIDNVPTSGLVMIEFKIVSWSDLKPGITALTIFPKDLRRKS